MASKVLIIDDDEQDQKIMKRYLSKNGYPDIYIADTGEDGLNLAKENKPDIAIIDTNLPGINGFETCKQIKAIEDLNNIKVIIVTGLIDSVNALKARQMGADDYCAKTTDCVELLEVMNDLLDTNEK